MSDCFPFRENPCFYFYLFIYLFFFFLFYFFFFFFFFYFFFFKIFVQEPKQEVAKVVSLFVNLAKLYQSPLDKYGLVVVVRIFNATRHPRHIEAGSTVVYMYLYSLDSMDHSCTLGVLSVT